MLRIFIYIFKFLQHFEVFVIILIFQVRKQMLRDCVLYPSHQAVMAQTQVQLSHFISLCSWELIEHFRHATLFFFLFLVWVMREKHAEKNFPAGVNSLPFISQLGRIKEAFGAISVRIALRNLLSRSISKL